MLRLLTAAEKIVYACDRKCQNGNGCKSAGKVFADKTDARRHAEGVSGSVDQDAEAEDAPAERDPDEFDPRSAAELRYESERKQRDIAANALRVAAESGAGDARAAALDAVHVEDVEESPLLAAMFDDDDGS